MSLMLMVALIGGFLAFSFPMVCGALGCLPKASAVMRPVVTYNVDHAEYTAVARKSPIDYVIKR